jgi:adiponectin receptor
MRVDLTAHEAEPWQRFPYITRGYRSAGGSRRACLASMLRLHNETVNAWTMVASLLVGTVGFWAAAGVPRSSPFVAMYAAQAVHALASIGYHTFMCASESTANWWRRLDLCLIFLMNVATSYGITYFTLSSPASRALAVLTSAVAAVTGIAHALKLRPGQPMRRGSVTALIGLSNLPVYVALMWYGLLADGWVLAIGCAVLTCHAVGGACYALHWPQRCSPRGRFDLCGFSHNIMHVACFASYNLCWPFLAHMSGKKETDK